MIEQLQPGDVVEGEVVRLTPFGAILDYQGISCLLPLSQMSWKWLDDPAEIVNLGEKIQAEVLTIDLEKKRVGLSSRNLLPNPWSRIKKTPAPNDKLEGVVTGVKEFGALIEVFPDVEALLPKAELADFVETTGRPPEIGERLEVYVTQAHLENQILKVTHKPIS